MGRREFLKSAVRGAGLLPIAQVLGHLPQAEAQVVGPDNSTRVYKSGDTIKDRIATVEIQGWNIYIDKYELSSGKRVDYELIGNALRTIAMEFGSPNYDRDFKKNGRERERVVVLPRFNIDYAVLVIGDRENEILERPSFYPILLEGHQPRGAYAAIFSEAPLDSSLIGKIDELYAIFRNVTGFRFPPIYIHNIEDETVREGGSTGDYIRLPSIIFTKPKIEGEGFIKLYDALVSSGLMQPGFLDENLESLVKLQQAYIHFTTAVGFDKEKYHYGLVQSDKENERKKEIEEAERYRKEIQNNPNLRIFDLTSYLKNSGIEDEPMRNNPPLYLEAFFSSAMTIFRFFPGEFIRRYNILNPEEKIAVTNASNSVLDYLESLVFSEAKSIDRMMPDPKIIRLLPSYTTLRQTLNG